jgi:hypothetical protein
MHGRERATFGSWLIAAAAGVLTLFVCAVPALAQDRIAVPGTSVTLTAPPGFSRSRTPRSIENTATGSSITISERSAEAYEEMAQLFSSARELSQAYANQDVSIRSVRRLDGGIPFAVGRQTTGGKEIVKYLALLRGDRTVLVTFNLADSSFTEADAEAVLRSVEIARAPTLEEQLSTLPFTFRVVEPYSVARVVPRSAVTLAVEGDDEQPVIVIGEGRSRAVMGDEARVAVELLRGTGGFGSAEITAQGPTAFGGGAGYGVRAMVEDQSVVQYLRIVPGGAYLRLLARGPTGAMRSAETTIDAIAGSVEPR